MKLQHYYGQILLGGHRNNPSFSEATHDLRRATAHLSRALFAG